MRKLSRFESGSRESSPQPMLRGVSLISPMSRSLSLPPWDYSCSKKRKFSPSRPLKSTFFWTDLSLQRNW